MLIIKRHILALEFLFLDSKCLFVLDVQKIEGWVWFFFFWKKLATSVCWYWKGHCGNFRQTICGCIISSKKPRVLRNLGLINMSKNLPNDLHGPIWFLMRWVEFLKNSSVLLACIYFVFVFFISKCFIGIHFTFESASNYKRFE